MILVSVFKALLTEWKLMFVIIKVILVSNFKMFRFKCKLLPVTFYLIVSEVGKSNFVTVTSPMQLNKHGNKWHYKQFLKIFANVDFLKIKALLFGC